MEPTIINDKDKERRKLYYEKNKDAILTKKKEFYQKNKPEIIKKVMEHHTANPQLKKEQFKKRYQANKEEYKKVINVPLSVIIGSFIIIIITTGMTDKNGLKALIGGYSGFGFGGY
jgi:flagellar biosynthesis protein FliP